MSIGLEALPITLTLGELGAFDLVGEGDSWLCATLAGTDIAGNPIPVEVAIQSLIQDGSVSFTEHYDNSTLTILVCLTGPDAAALDAGAAALFAQVGKPNVLTYTGPQALEPIAWDVVNSHFERSWDDLAEVRGDRYYTVTLTCLPFRRATVETVTVALPAAGTTTVNVDDGTSAVDWIGFPGTVIAAGGAVSVTGPAATGKQGLWMALQEIVDTSDTPYVVVDWSVTATSQPVLRLNASGTNASVDPGDGVGYPKIAEAASPIAGYTRSWFLVTDPSVPYLRFDLATFSFGGADESRIPPGPRVFSIANIDRTDTPPGTARQQLRRIPIRGSARTPGAIAIEHETNALGDVLAYFWPDDGSGSIPNTRQFQTAGGSSVDAAAVSGVRTQITTSAFVAEIPTRRLHSGGHLLEARLKAASTLDATVTWAATTMVNGVDLGPTVGGTRVIGLTSGYAFIPLGRLVLPTRGVDPAGAGAVVRLTISATASGAVNLDEAWLFNRLIGQMVRVACGIGTPSSGGPSNRLFIEPPTVSSGRATLRPVVRRGFAADRSDSFHPLDVSAWQFPQFPPDGVNALVVTSNTAGANVSFRHFERLAG